MSGLWALHLRFWHPKWGMELQRRLRARLLRGKVLRRVVLHQEAVVIALAVLCWVHRIIIINKIEPCIRTCRRREGGRYSKLGTRVRSNSRWVVDGQVLHVLAADSGILSGLTCARRTELRVGLPRPRLGEAFVLGSYMLLIGTSVVIAGCRLALGTGVQPLHERSSSKASIGI